MTQWLLAAAIGAGASVIANAIWHFLTEPRLNLRDPVCTSRQLQAKGAPESFFWGAPVAMEEPNLVSRRPALAVRALAEIRRPGDDRPFTSFTCRWQGTPQPVVPTKDGYIPNVAGIPLGERGEVYQHRAEAIDLFVKHEGEPGFYGFPNESYFYGWRHPGFHFRGSQYFVRLRVLYERREDVLELEVLNPGNRAGEFSMTVRDRFTRNGFDLVGR